MSDQSPPRLPSSFPKSPASVKRQRGTARDPDNGHPLSSPTTGHAIPGVAFKSRLSPDGRPVAVIPGPQAGARGPMIPISIADGPTQRLYAVGAFVVLQACKLYDLSLLYGDHQDPVTELWFCMKWLVLDGCFFWFLPMLRIPWMTFSQSFTMSAIACLSVLDIILSLKYYVPVSAILASIWRVIYDRELSISEKSVKWSDIVHNSSHIQGKYTVHILPEGTAKLNPEGNCFCLGPGSPSVSIPIRINGSQPIKVELLRIGLETADVETIHLSQKEIKKLLKKLPREEDPRLRYLPLTVKRPGLYRLSKVVDVTEMDVRVQRAEALVVPCPKAFIKVSRKRNSDLCVGELSDLSIQVEGLAPLQITYAREHNGKPTVFTVQRIHPENYDSPLLAGFINDGTLAEQGDKDLAWARSESVPISLNETLNQEGEWTYEIQRVSDACGNTVDLKSYASEMDSWVGTRNGNRLVQKINIHERPLARFVGYDTQTPMELPKGKSGGLPLSVSLPGGDAPFRLKYSFTPYSNLGPSSERAHESVEKDVQIKSSSEVVLIREPGLYTLRSLSSSYCSGSILEPAACLVITPPEPSLSMEYDEILDKCTQSSIGLTIDLTIVGSPPFDLHYRLVKDGGSPQVKSLHIERTRHQVRFTPEDAGHYAYEFFALDDKNYARVMIDGRNHRVEQTVKPLAGASFVGPSSKKVCIDESATFDVRLHGTPPFALHYDLIHDGKRRRISASSIEGLTYTIETPSFSKGGDYSLALISVEDQSGCKKYLESEAKISVRFQRPKAQFGEIDGSYSIQALEGRKVKLPLRLTGERPWSVSVGKSGPDVTPNQVLLNDPNPWIEVSEAGTYQLYEVRDASCPGAVEDKKSKFDVSWVEKPKIRLPASASLSDGDAALVKKHICEGDEDAAELAFTGSPPFTIDYDTTFHVDSNKRPTEQIHHSFTAGLGVGSVRMESSRPGKYRYSFIRITDGLYVDPKDGAINPPLVLEQKVYARPSSSFVNPNKVYKYCLDSVAGDDSIIPINLQGVPPFSLSIRIKHQSTGKYDLIQVPHIDATHFDFKIPTHALTLGDHLVSVTKVKDAHGCSRKTIDGPSVMVAVADMPAVSSLDQRDDYCVGERIGFSLSGVPAFAVDYEWNGVLMKAVNQPSQFVRVAERPGNFTIVGLQDSASDCRVRLSVTKIIHEVPSVRISEGASVVKGIPEGDQAEITFTFYGTPPFTFTYTRSEIAKKGQKPRILEMHSHTVDSYTYSLFASRAGTYEVISIEDKYCSYASSGKHKA